MTTHTRGYRDADRARVLGNRLRFRARELGMKYVELAEKTRLPYKTLMNYLDGKRTPDLFTLAKIAAALETSPDALHTGRSFLPFVDPAMFAAQTRLLENLPELREDDLLLIADVVATVQSRRSEERRSARLHPIVFDTLQQIYREIIPRIIQEYAPAHLMAGYHTEQSGQVHFQIACACGPRTDIAACRQKIGQYLQHKLKLGPRKLSVGDAPDFDMEFRFPVGAQTSPAWRNPSE